MKHDKPDGVKMLSGFIQDAVSPHLEQLADHAAVKAVNARDNQTVSLRLSVKVERNEKGLYLIDPECSVSVTDTDKFETVKSKFDPAQMTIEAVTGKGE